MVAIGCSIDVSVMHVMFTFNKMASANLANQLMADEKAERSLRKEGFRVPSNLSFKISCFKLAVLLQLAIWYAA